MLKIPAVLNQADKDYSYESLRQSLADRFPDHKLINLELTVNCIQQQKFRCIIARDFNIDLNITNICLYGHTVKLLSRTIILSYVNYFA